MPGIKVVVSRCGLIGGGTGIHGTVILAENQLHVIAAVIHVSRKGEIDSDLGARGAGNVKFSSRSGSVFGDCFGDAGKDIAEIEIIVDGCVL